MHGFEVIDKSQFGTTTVVRKAVISGEIDLYPEYTGNGSFFFDETDSSVWKNAEQGYQRVKELDKAENNTEWLTPAPANNTWAIAIPKSLAEQENLNSLDDFTAYVNRGGYVKLIGSEEFVTSPAALPAFQEAYGFTLTQDQLLVVSSGDTTQP
jgi:osmoprotectant transport system substrate-binding protein